MKPCCASLNDTTSLGVIDTANGMHSPIPSYVTSASAHVRPSSTERLTTSLGAPSAGPQGLRGCVIVHMCIVSRANTRSGTSANSRETHVAPPSSERSSQLRRVAHNPPPWMSPAWSTWAASSGSSPPVGSTVGRDGVGAGVVVAFAGVIVALAGVIETALLTVAWLAWLPWNSGRRATARARTHTAARPAAARRPGAGREGTALVSAPSTRRTSAVESVGVRPA